MRKTEISTVIGYGIGIFCILFSIKMAGNLSSFWNAPSVFITIGGTLGSVVVAFPMARLKKLGPVIKKSFKKEKYDLVKDIDTVVELSETARRKGILALDDIAEQYDHDPFLQKGIMFIVDGMDKEQLRTSLQTELYFTQKRHQKGHSMLDMIANTVTSLGLLGTYIGLIPMLENLDDPTKLGPLMAVELVTSFYGAFISYVIFSPMSKKLKSMSADEMVRNEFLIEGLVAIQEGQNPKMIRETLTLYLSKKEMKSEPKRGRRSKVKVREVA